MNVYAFLHICIYEDRLIPLGIKFRKKNILAELSLFAASEDWFSLQTFYFILAEISMQVTASYFNIEAIYIYIYMNIRNIYDYVYILCTHMHLGASVNSINFNLEAE